jgi:hypothetical protein
MMKKILFTITGLAVMCGCFLQAQAQKKTPKWVEKAKKAVIRLEIQDKNGITRNGNGFFVQDNGEAVSDYTLFAGATNAFATDAEGRRMAVTQILGADAFYDVVRFKVDVPERVTALRVAASPPAQGVDVFLLPFDAGKNDLLPGGTIAEVSAVKGDYGYYRIDAPLSAAQVSLPLLTAGGEVFALAQADAAGKNRTFGISVPYVLSLRVGAMDVFNQTYSDIGIRKAWAETPEDAQVALMFYATQQEAPAYLETLNDFIATFPDYAGGYVNRASHRAYRRQELAAPEAEQLQMLSQALADLQTAAKYMEKKGEGFYEQAKLIYGVASTDSALASSTEWSMDAAWANIRRATDLDDEPAYRQLEGDIAFYRGDMEQAYTSYRSVTQSPLASALSYYMAARCLQQTPGASQEEIILLLDSATEKSANAPEDALVYLQEAAELKMQSGRYEEAVKDYDRCYILMGGRVTDAFYYYREQARFRAGDLEGALKDISAAIVADPENAVYYAEEAAIYLRRQDPAGAQASLQRALTLDPDFASCHRLLGVSYLRQEKKDDACRAFHKAKELGDPLVNKLIKENCQ